MPSRSSAAAMNRGFVVALIVISFASLIACSSSGDDASGADTSASSSDGWRFTDDRGVTHNVVEVPTVIAAQSAAAGGLWDYGIEVDGVFGPLRRADGSPDPAIGRADPGTFQSLGEVDSEINMEALAALQPDIIVTGMWGENEYWGIDESTVDELEQIAPIVGIRVDNRLVTEPLARFAELAESLGAEPSRVTGAKAAFDDASQRLTTSLQAKAGLRVVAASGTPSEMYIAYPPAFPDLAYFQSLGMALAEPIDHPTSNGFWETLSWEQAGKYPADVILADARGGTVPEIRAQLPATAAALPAVEADQLISWQTAHAYGYQNFAAILNDLADSFDDAETTSA